MKCFDRPSPNFDDRANGAKPELIIVHYTSMESTAAALTRLTDPAAKVSSHYLIDEKGNIFTLVNEEKRAWHAGVSSWMGKDDVNSRSIGIELSNRNGEPYTNQQLFALAILCKDIMHRNNIPPENIIGHSDVAPGRKFDPGTHFPWEKMARHDVGRWPAPTLADAFNAAAVAKSPVRLKKLFNDAGYTVHAHGKDTPALKDVIFAFQQHFEPEVFEDANGTPGKATETTVARLRAIARLNREAAAENTPPVKPATPPPPAP
ncbi:MAG: N-acetylmuramoyl-L-alanine amidase [Micavibrio sp.]|nr:N-acetylmuramoyl-L-alanine amidase [Micavibrio sp.]